MKKSQANQQVKYKTKNRTIFKKDKHGRMTKSTGPVREGGVEVPQWLCIGPKDMSKEPAFDFRTEKSMREFYGDAAIGIGCRSHPRVSK